MGIEGWKKILFYTELNDSIYLRKALIIFFKTNLALQNKGKRGTPVCIWGTHGLGNNASSEFAKNNWQLAYCAPAQFEEMGDLHGIPYQVDPDENIVGTNIPLSPHQIGFQNRKAL